MNIDQLETGDIILFNGNQCMSWLVKCFTESTWSHIGMVIKNPDFLINKPGIVQGTYLFMSDSKAELDVDDNITKFGVQLVNLQDYITNYNGTASVRKLYSPNLTIDDKTKLMKSVYNTLYDKPYDFMPLDFVNIALRANKIKSKCIDILSGTRDIDEIVCSSVVAYAYTILGILKNDTEWATIAPKYFANLIDRDLQNNATLGQLVQLK